MNYRRPSPKVRAILLRTIAATLCSAILVAFSVASNFLTAAPRFLSLIFEPLSMLLMPGLLVSLILAGPHDFSPNVVLFVSLIFYALFFYAAFTVLARRSRSGPNP